MLLTYWQIKKNDFDLYLDENEGSLNITQLIRDVDANEELDFSYGGLGQVGLQILVDVIKQKNNKVRENFIKS